MGPYILRFVPTNDDRYAYWQAVAQVWQSPEAFVNVEWDMEFSPALVDALLACPQPLCTHAYQMHNARQPYWAHGQMPAEEGLRRQAAGIQWISEGEQWAEYSGIGFCKITPQARVSAPERAEWPAVEQMVNRVVQGPWHVHWGPSGKGIAHYHTKDEQRIVERY